MLSSKPYRAANVGPVLFRHTLRLVAAGELPAAWTIARFGYGYATAIGDRKGLGMFLFQKARIAAHSVMTGRLAIELFVAAFALAEREEDRDAMFLCHAGIAAAALVLMDDRLFFESARAAIEMEDQYDLIPVILAARALLFYRDGRRDLCIEDLADAVAIAEAHKLQELAYVQGVYAELGAGLAPAKIHELLPKLAAILCGRVVTLRITTAETHRSESHT